MLFVKGNKDKTSNKIWKKIIFSFLACLLWGGFVHCDSFEDFYSDYFGKFESFIDKHEGETTFSSLNVPFGGRAEALSGVFTALANDISFFEYNPAASSLLKNTELAITENSIRDIIRYYTREAGVRGLEREISRICRKVVKMLLLKKQNRKVMVTPRNIGKYLGVRQFDFGIAEKENQIGQVSGLAWTEVGGEMLTIEAVTVPGKGNIIRTGTLGDVMKESIEAARTVVKSRANKLGIRNEAFEKTDIHIHVPEGATPKDGPSAGISMATALVSVFSGIPVRADVAMTGEITLRGEVLPIGGVKEKLLAALRGGIKTVIIPEENTKDLVEIPDNVKNKLEILPVRWIDKVLEIALERQPEEIKEDQEEVPATVASESTENPSDNNLMRH